MVVARVDVVAGRRGASPLRIYGRRSDHSPRPVLLRRLPLLVLRLLPNFPVTVAVAGVHTSSIIKIAS